MASTVAYGKALLRVASYGLRVIVKWKLGDNLCLDAEQSPS